MLKFVYCVRRRPDISLEEFRKYWLEHHGPLVRSYAKNSACEKIRLKPYHRQPSECFGTGSAGKQGAV